MEQQLSEVGMILTVWMLREFIGYMTQGRKLDKVVKRNSEHIERVEKILKIQKKEQEKEEGYLV